MGIGLWGQDYVKKSMWSRLCGLKSAWLSSGGHGHEVKVIESR